MVKAHGRSRNENRWYETGSSLVEKSLTHLQENIGFLASTDCPLTIDDCERHTSDAPFRCCRTHPDDFFFKVFGRKEL